MLWAWLRNYGLTRWRFTRGNHWTQSTALSCQQSFCRARSPSLLLESPLNTTIREAEIRRELGSKNAWQRSKEASMLWHFLVAALRPSL
jgi:hypothetical protein